MNRLAIVGGGAAGGEFFRQFVEATHARGVMGRREVTMFEPRETVGLGVAWSATNPLLAANMPLQTLTTDALKPTQILDQTGFRTQGYERPTYPQRSFVGDWLTKRVCETFEKAPAAGVDVRHRRHTVHAVRRYGSGFNVAYGDGAEQYFDQVVLAVGNIPSPSYPDLAGAPGYFSNPWNVEALNEAISSDARILIIGAGPTAIDLVNVLTSDDQRPPMVMASRTGRVPWVRPLYNATSPLTFITHERLGAYLGGGAAKLSLRELLMMLDGEFAKAGVTLEDLARIRASAGQEPAVSLTAGLAHAGTYQPYFTTLKAIDSIVPEMWNALDAQAKQVVWSRWRAEHARISYAMPQFNAARLMRRLQEGRLEIHDRLESVRYDATHRRFVAIRVEAGGQISEREYDVVIDAAGIGGPLSSLDSPLVRQMHADGLLAEHPYSGACVEFGTGQVLDANGARISGLYALAGPLTQGVHYFVNALLEVSKSASRTAEAVADDVLGVRSRGPRLAWPAAVQEVAL